VQFHSHLLNNWITSSMKLRRQTVSRGGQSCLQVRVLHRHHKEGKAHAASDDRPDHYSLSSSDNDCYQPVNETRTVNLTGFVLLDDLKE
jgi:hypothetical protein